MGPPRPSRRPPAKTLARAQAPRAVQLLGLSTKLLVHVHPRGSQAFSVSPGEGSPVTAEGPQINGATGSLSRAGLELAVEADHEVIAAPGARSVGRPSGGLGASASAFLQETDLGLTTARRLHATSETRSIPPMAPPERRGPAATTSGHSAEGGSDAAGAAGSAPLKSKAQERAAEYLAPLLDVEVSANGESGVEDEKAELSSSALEKTTRTMGTSEQRGGARGARRASTPLPLSRRGLKKRDLRAVFAEERAAADAEKAAESEQPPAYPLAVRGSSTTRLLGNPFALGRFAGETTFFEKADADYKLQAFRAWTKPEEHDTNGTSVLPMAQSFFDPDNHVRKFDMTKLIFGGRGFFKGLDFSFHQPARPGQVVEANWRVQGEYSWEGRSLLIESRHAGAQTTASKVSTYPRAVAAMEKRLNRRFNNRLLRFATKFRLDFTLYADAKQLHYDPNNPKWAEYVKNHEKLQCWSYKCKGKTKDETRRNPYVVTCRPKDYFAACQVKVESGILGIGAKWKQDFAAEHTYELYPYAMAMKRIMTLDLEYRVQLITGFDPEKKQPNFGLDSWEQPTYTVKKWWKNNMPDLLGTLSMQVTDNYAAKASEKTACISRAYWVKDLRYKYEMEVRPKKDIAMMILLQTMKTRVEVNQRQLRMVLRAIYYGPTIMTTVGSIASASGFAAGAGKSVVSGQTSPQQFISQVNHVAMSAKDSLTWDNFVQGFKSLGASVKQLAMSAREKLTAGVGQALSGAKDAAVAVKQDPAQVWHALRDSTVHAARFVAEKGSGAAHAAKELGQKAAEQTPVLLRAAAKGLGQMGRTAAETAKFAVRDPRAAVENIKLAVANLGTALAALKESGKAAAGAVGSKVLEAGTAQGVKIGADFAAGQAAGEAAAAGGNVAASVGAAAMQNSANGVAQLQSLGEAFSLAKTTQERLAAVAAALTNKGLAGVKLAAEPLAWVALGSGRGKAGTQGSSFYQVKTVAATGLATIPSGESPAEGEGQTHPAERTVAATSGMLDHLKSAWGNELEVAQMSAKQTKLQENLAKTSHKLEQLNKEAAEAREQMAQDEAAGRVIDKLHAANEPRMQLLEALRKHKQLLQAITQVTAEIAKLEKKKATVVALQVAKEQTESANRLVEKQTNAAVMDLRNAAAGGDAGPAGQAATGLLAGGEGEGGGGVVAGAEQGAEGEAAAAAAEQQGAAASEQTLAAQQVSAEDVTAVAQMLAAQFKNMEQQKLQLLAAEETKSNVLALLGEAAGKSVEDMRQMSPDELGDMVTHVWNDMGGVASEDNTEQEQLQLQGEGANGGNEEGAADASPTEVDEAD